MDLSIVEPWSNAAQTPHRIGMVGMFAGMWGEFNPGCFMLGIKTRHELEKRFPASLIDLYSIHNKLQGSVLMPVKQNGLNLTFFPREGQLNFLNDTLSQYNALVFGGDIIWGGDDVVEDNDIFFLKSPEFLATAKPVVAFNAVHTFYTDDNIAPEIEKFQDAALRASYTSVRTTAIRDRLIRHGVLNVDYCPDPVIDLSPDMLPESDPLPEIPRNGKPNLGVSIRGKLSDEVLQTLSALNLDDYNVVVFPYSKQYACLETVQKIKAVFGDKFHYLEEYLDPVQSYKYIGQLDYTIQDTYHGIIASILYNKPFISLDVEPEYTSRKQQLLELLGIDQKYNIRLISGKTAENIGVLKSSIPELLGQELRMDPVKVAEARTRIRNHFDRIAEVIKNNLGPVLQPENQPLP